MSDDQLELTSLQDAMSSEEQQNVNGSQIYFARLKITLFVYKLYTLHGSKLVVLECGYLACKYECINICVCSRF
jgi:hypothetical protein